MAKAVKLLLPVLGVLFLAGPAFSADEGKQKGENIKFSVHMWAEYTDNRDASEDEEENVDFFLRPRLEGELQWSGGRRVLGFYYEPAFRYRSNANEIQNDSQLYHDLTAKYDHKVARSFKGRIHEKLNITDDPSVSKGGSTLRRDSSYLLNNGEVGVNYAFSRKEYIDLKLNHMMKRYEETERKQESDKDSLGFSVMGWRQFTRTMGVLASAGYNDFGYNEFEGVDRGFASIQVATGIRKVFSSSKMFDAQIGWTSMEYADSSLDSSSSPYVLIGGRFSPNPATRFTGGLTYSLRDSDIYPFASQQSLTISVRAEKDLNKKVAVGLTTAYRNGDYDSETTDSDGVDYLAENGLESEGSEDVVVVAADLGYKLSLNTSVRLIQQFENVNSDVSIEYTRNSTRLVMSKSF